MLLTSLRNNVYSKILNDLSTEELLAIPEGFNNNILWNVGHVVVTQQTLTYGLAGQPMHVPDEYLGLYRKGTSPKDWQDTPDIEELKSLVVELPEKFIADYESGHFANYKGYTSAGTGAVLNTIDDGIAFNDFHEGLHLGNILDLRKFI